MLDRQRRSLEHYLRRADTPLAGAARRISPLRGADYRGSRIKRVMDVSIALPLWIATLPVQAVARTLVKIEDGVSSSYVDNDRFVIDRDGSRRKLALKKIRSMRNDADDITVPIHLRNTQNDPRILKVGKVIRALNIDELPQLWQVVKGDMTLIGLRIARESEIYGANGKSPFVPPPELAKWEDAYRGKPGILNPQAAIYGNERKGGEVRLRVIPDEHYARQASLGMDLYYLARFALGIHKRRSHR